MVPFGRALVDEGLLDPRVLARHGLDAVLYASRGERGDAVRRLRRDLLTVAAGREHAPLARVAGRIGRELVADMHPTARWMVDQHLSAGDFCVVLSGSVQELVDGVAFALGAHRGVGTRAEVTDGLLTGELSGPLCHGAAKLERLRDELGDVDLRRAVAYADSRSDLPVLCSVGTAVAVNPDRRLAREARRRGWPTVNFG